MKIAIINGPNLNLLGQREPGIYGQQSFDDYIRQLRAEFSDIEITYFQSNVEGELVTALQESSRTCQGIVLNPAAYTHTSIAIGDAVAAIQIPVVEVHISNVQAREEFRKLSYVSAKAVGTITGLGLKGYELAIRWLLSKQHP